MALDSAPPKVPSAKGNVSLAWQAAFHILLFYSLTISSVALLVFFLLLEFLLLIVLLRFGLIGIITPVIEKHGEVVKMLLSGLLLKRGVNHRLILKAEDAPQLFALVREVSEKAQVEFPHEISLAMDLNASVELRGMRQGKGRTILNLGYDLLAGMSIEEFRAVLGHEMIHAKAVKRGFSSWGKKSLARVSTISTNLFNFCFALQQAKKKPGLLKLLSKTFDQLNRKIAKLMAAYSRHDEFEADAGAAELAGASAMRAALIRLEQLGELSGKMQWAERLGQLRGGRSVSSWLVAQFSQASPLSSSNSEEFHNSYSTHPALKQRLDALPPADLPAEQFLASPRAISLLENADSLAEEMISKVERLSAIQEEKDSKRLLKWTSKLRRNKHVSWRGLAGVVSMGLGLFLLFFWIFIDTSSLPIGGYIVVLLGGGAGLYWWAKYRERFSVPIPSFALIKSGWRAKPLTEQEEKTIEDSFNGKLASIKKKSAREQFLLDLSYEALEIAEFKEAFTAARLALNIRKSVEASAAVAITSAALNMPQNVQAGLEYMLNKAGTKGKSGPWTMAWVSFLQGSWPEAEAFLQLCLKQYPQKDVFHAMLAVCQSNRGKIQMAMLNARKALEGDPKNLEYVKLLVGLLIEEGYLKEAHDLFANLDPKSFEDLDLMIWHIRFLSLAGEKEQLESSISTLESKSPSPEYYMTLGRLFEANHQLERSESFYQKALEFAHFPEAELALGRISVARESFPSAKQQFLKSLNVTKTAHDRAAGALSLFPEVMARLAAMVPPIKCRAWIAHLDGKVEPPFLREQSFLIYAPSLSAANEYFMEVLAAMRQSLPPILGTSVTWKEADHEMQPDEPVRPGLQSVL